MNGCDNFDLFTSALLLNLLLVFAHTDVEILHDLVLDTVTILGRDSLAVLVDLDIDETKQTTRLRILYSLLHVLANSACSKLVVAFLSTLNCCHSRLAVADGLCLFGEAFFFRTAKIASLEGITEVGVLAEVDSVSWGAQSLPIQFLNRLHALEVIFSERGVLLSHDFHVMWPHRVPPRTQEEDKALALKRL